MAIFIPKKKEFWQRKPIGILQFAYSNEISSSLDLFMPLDGSLRAFGESASSDTTLESSGADTVYLQWKSDGIENSIYDGVYSDGMGMRTHLSKPLIYTDRVVGAQIRSVQGSFTITNFVIGGDSWTDSKSCAGTRHNGFSVVNNLDINVEIAARLTTFVGAFNRDGQPHTYIAHIATNGTRDVSLFIDGVLFATQPVDIASFKINNEFNLGAGDWQNRGLNGVINSCFFINGRVDIELARSLSEAPYQILKPKKTYFSFSEAQATSTFWVQRKKEFSTEKPINAELSNAAPNLEYALLFSNANELLVDSVSQTQMDSSGVIGLSWFGEEPSIDFNGSNTIIKLPTISNVGTINIHMRAYVHNLANYHTLLDINEKLQLYFSNGDALRIWGYSSSKKLHANMSTGFMDIWIEVNDSADTVKTWVNGVQGTTYTGDNAGGFSISGTGISRIGANRSNTQIADMDLISCVVMRDSNHLREQFLEAPYQILKPRKTYLSLSTAVPASATLSGSAIASITKWDIKAGGKQIILDLTNDTWVAAGAAFDAIRQDILDGLVAAQNEINGWNNVVTPNEPVTSVVRTSSTRVTITLEAH